jgi:hypothetical protein
VVKVVWYELFYRKVDPKMIDVVLEWVIKVCLVPFQNVTHTLLLKKDDIELTTIRSSWEQCFVVFVTSFVTYFYTVDSGDLTADLVSQFTKDIKATRIWSTLDRSLQKNGIPNTKVESILTRTTQVLLTELQDHPFGNLISRKQSLVSTMSKVLDASSLTTHLTGRHFKGPFYRSVNFHALPNSLKLTHLNPKPIPFHSTHNQNNYNCPCLDCGLLQPFYDANLTDEQIFQIRFLLPAFCPKESSVYHKYSSGTVCKECGWDRIKENYMDFVSKGTLQSIAKKHKTVVQKEVIQRITIEFQMLKKIDSELVLRWDPVIKYTIQDFKKYLINKKNNALIYDRYIITHNSTGKPIIPKEVTEEEFEFTVDGTYKRPLLLYKDSHGISYYDAITWQKMINKNGHFEETRAFFHKRYSLYNQIAMLGMEYEKVVNSDQEIESFVSNTLENMKELVRQLVIHLNQNSKSFHGKLAEGRLVNLMKRFYDDIHNLNWETNSIDTQKHTGEYISGLKALEHNEARNALLSEIIEILLELFEDETNENINEIKDWMDTQFNAPLPFKSDLRLNNFGHLLQSIEYKTFLRHLKEDMNVSVDVPDATESFENEVTEEESGYDMEPVSDDEGFDEEVDYEAE